MPASLGAPGVRMPLWRKYFHRRPVEPRELPLIMRKHIYTGAMGNVYFGLISGIFFTFYGQAIGLKVMTWGNLLGVASFLLTGQILSAYVTQRLGRRKVVWFTCALTSRVLRIVAILSSYWLWRQGSANVAAVLMGLVWLSIFLGAMADPPWFSWLADIIPERRHGGFWGRRSQLITVVVLAIVIPVAYVVDAVPKAWQVHVMVGIFCAAALIGIADLLIHGTIPEPAPAVPRDPNFGRHLLAPLKDRAFRPWLVFISCWTFGMTFGGSLNFFHWLSGELALRDHLVQAVLVLGAIPMVGNLVFARRWGELVDRYGPKKVLLWGHFFWSLLPLFWIAATQHGAPRWWSTSWLVVAALCGGVSSNAAMIAANKLITRHPPAKDRAMYVAVSSCLASIAGGLGPILEGVLIRYVLGEAWQTRVVGLTVVAFHVAYVTSLVLRLASARLLLTRVPDLRPAPGVDESPVEAPAAIRLPAPAVSPAPVPVASLSRSVSA